jgi:Transposase family tnp2
MLRHPADSPEWTSIDIMHSDFSSDLRNLRIELCTDRMNPYENMSSRHITWRVLLCIYNLPPWLCMKRRYIMISLMISGPKQPGNDIDVFLAPLIEELKKFMGERSESMGCISERVFYPLCHVFVHN